MDDQVQQEGPEELLRTATTAAARGDPIGMIEALTASGFLFGLVRRLQKQWSKLPPTEVDDCVAVAVDSAFAAVSAGRPVRNLGGWLWKVASNAAQDRWDADFSERARGELEIDGIAGPEVEDTVRRREREALDDHRRAEAIRLARALLPLIGEGQVVDVMELVIDAAAQGLPDLPSAEIAEALGISEGSARKLVSRGLQRMRREAERAGVEMPEDLPETRMDEEGEDEW
ncbi:sigma-70 family RNA polymerase sigma factor [Aquibium sp. A9E412]|uniref:RNA polymerase sigma factor n=1 Tax=Aquibium sp. A9E412 TaxID=2976767 RepID=UPI0025AF69E3|nr:sigma-70 family RNA polymerase sigma factor [Aquibium sp. A9E412]MDN2565291.1 sigma-70 family RNA polymerase sigma factor [Aquibium sp. A9E412]